MGSLEINRRCMLKSTRFVAGCDDAGARVSDKPQVPSMPPHLIPLARLDSANPGNRNSRCEVTRNVHRAKGPSTLRALSQVSVAISGFKAKCPGASGMPDIV